jgi:hypothetical protein
LRDVAHHAGLLFIGAADGHADGNFRHLLSLPLLLLRTLHSAEGFSSSRHEAQARHLAPTSSSAKADDPVFRAASVQFRRHGVLDAHLPAFAGMTTKLIPFHIMPIQELADFFDH